MQKATRDEGSVPGSGRSPGVGNGNLLQYSYLKKFQGQRDLVGYSPWDHKELDTIEQLSTHTEELLLLFSYSVVSNCL